MSLVDRDCVILDGSCDCMIPVKDHCKYLKYPKDCYYRSEENKEQIRREYSKTDKKE